MSLILRSYIKFEGMFFRRYFDNLTKNPASSQMQYLMKVIRNNSDTHYGKEYGFSSISSKKDYRDHVPINQYNDLEPYVSQMANGEQNVLTSDDTQMFNLTSGTTAKPKYIPVTPSAKRLPSAPTRTSLSCTTTCRSRGVPLSGRAGGR